MKEGLLFLLILFVMASTESNIDEWEKFKSDHGRNFDDPAEDQHRKEIFLKSKQKIDEHNKKYAEGSVTYKMGINKFADRTEDEVKEMTGGARRSSTKY